MDTSSSEGGPTLPIVERGLHRKFDVRRVDGSDAPGEKHNGCEYFVLDLSHDPFARSALHAYAEACAATHPALAADLRARFGLPMSGRINAPADALAVLKSDAHSADAAASALARSEGSAA